MGCSRKLDLLCKDPTTGTWGRVCWGLSSIASLRYCGLNCWLVLQRCRAGAGPRAGRHGSDLSRPRNRASGVARTGLEATPCRRRSNPPQCCMAKRCRSAATVPARWVFAGNPKVPPRCRHLEGDYRFRRSFLCQHGHIRDVPQEIEARDDEVRAQPFTTNPLLVKIAAYSRCRIFVADQTFTTFSRI